MNNSYSESYKAAGVDVTAGYEGVRLMKGDVERTRIPGCISGIGGFGGLFQPDLTDIKEPVLVLKSEEPGSKQKLAMEYGYTESICHDMINHLVNDIAVMGAKPLAVLDTIVCGNAEKDTIHSLVKGVADACRNNECSLVGGETSIQPSVLDAGLYVLTASIAGLVEKAEVIDGSKIQAGDVVLAIASNGLHTNGYSLVRLLMNKMPQIKLDKIGGETFIEQIMRPHTPYYKAVKELFSFGALHGMAHITGGGIEGNLCRVIPDGLGAVIDLSKLRVLDIFKYIRNIGNISDAEMLRTFNCGVGFNLVVPEKDKERVMAHIAQYYDCYEIGRIEHSTVKIVFENKLNWL